MDRTQKFFRLLDRKTRARVLACIHSISLGSFDLLDIRALSGFPDTYRCRIGDIRIIFQKFPNGNSVIDVGFRKDVYKRLKR